MKSLNMKLVLSALGIALLATPALAQRPQHRQVSHQVQTQGQIPEVYPNPQTHSGSEQSRQSGNDDIGGGVY
jgi:hypothetical protein